MVGVKELEAYRRMEAALKRNCDLVGPAKKNKNYVVVVFSVLEQLPVEHLVLHHHFCGFTALTSILKTALKYLAREAPTISLLLP